MHLYFDFCGSGKSEDLNVKIKELKIKAEDSPNIKNNNFTIHTKSTKVTYRYIIPVLKKTLAVTNTFQKLVRMDLCSRCNVTLSVLHSSAFTRLQ